jgi:hypothetical protein
MKLATVTGPALPVCDCAHDSGGIAKTAIAQNVNLAFMSSSASVDFFDVRPLPALLGERLSGFVGARRIGGTYACTP